MNSTKQVFLSSPLTAPVYRTEANVNACNTQTKIIFSTHSLSVIVIYGFCITKVNCVKAKKPLYGEVGGCDVY